LFEKGDPRCAAEQPAIETCGSFLTKTRRDVP
jgi:hypothetical protein